MFVAPMGTSWVPSSERGHARDLVPGAVNISLTAVDIHEADLVEVDGDSAHGAS